MGRLYVYRGRRRAAVYDLGKGSCLIGRNFDADVVLDDDLASRRHAMILKTPKGLELSDLGSDNGVTIDGEPVRRAMLRDGTRFAIGRHILFYRESEAGVLTQATMRAIGRADPQVADIGRPAETTTSRLPQVELAAIQERTAATLEPHIAFPRSLGRDPFPLDGDRYVIGYSDDCDIRIPGGRMFVKEAVELLEDGDEEWVAVALHRRAGLRIHGAKTRMTPLREGDIFTVGRVQMTFRGRVA